PADLNDPITQRMRTDFTPLLADQTVDEALDWLRQHPPPGRVIYFYVVDNDGRLRGVVPTRRLVLSPPGTTISDIMVERTVALPCSLPRWSPSCWRIPPSRTGSIRSGRPRPG